MLDMREALDDHEAVDAGGEWVANAVYIVAGKIDEHDVFCAVFKGVFEFGGKDCIFVLVFASCNCSGNGVGYDAAEGGFHKEFWAGSDELEGRAINEEEVRGRIYGTEVPVYVERMESCGPGQALGGHGLDNVAVDNVGFKAGDVGFVAAAADVGGVLLILNYWWLGR
jgi:hypothetical protein